MPPARSRADREGEAIVVVAKSERSSNRTTSIHPVAVHRKPERFRQPRGLKERRDVHAPAFVRPVEAGQRFRGDVQLARLATAIAIGEGQVAREGLESIHVGEPVRQWRNGRCRADRAKHVGAHDVTHQLQRPGEQQGESGEILPLEGGEEGRNHLLQDARTGPIDTRAGPGSSIGVPFRSAARSLAKSPIFVGVAVVSLGLALALNTTMFALVDAVLHPVNPYPEPERVVIASFFGGDRQRFPSFGERYRAVRDGMHTYDAIGSYVLTSAMVQTRAVADEQLIVGISPDLFGLLGVRPMHGRGFRAAEPDAQAVIISFRLWNRLFQGQPLDRELTLTVGRGSYTVVGVMPRGVHFPFDADVWLPEASLPTDPAAWRAGPVPVMRLKRGVTLDAARDDLARVASGLTATYSPTRQIATRISIFGTRVASRNMVPPLIPGAVAMVLVIACANLGTLMLARGIARRRETAIRIALGADGRTIIRQVLAECAVIVGGGGVLGIVLTLWALRVVPHVATPRVPMLGDIVPVPSWRVFAFVLAACVAMIMLSGVVPAWRASRTDPAEPMKDGAGTTTGRVRDRYNPLIVLEVALSTALLMSAGLFVIFVVRLASFEFRYAAKRLVTTQLNVNARVAATDATVERFYNELLTRAASLPGARAAATRSFDQPDGGVVMAEEGKSGEQWLNLSGYAVVSPGYLRTFGISVIQGRDFSAGDRGSSTDAVIVDENAARRLWPDLASPVDRMIKLGNRGSPKPWLRVIGVVPAIEMRPRRDTDLPPEPMVYVLRGHDPNRSREVLVQADGASGDRGRAALALAVRQEIGDMAPQLGSPRVRPFLDDFEGTRTASAFMASLFGAFGGFGLVLCAVGLYGVLAYAVSRRAREFAVRVALGARRRDVARSVLHDAAVTALAGIGIGAFVALWITRALSESVVSVAYRDVIALLGAESVLLVVAFVACLGPVRQAMRADPMSILRAN